MSGSGLFVEDGIGSALESLGNMERAMQVFEAESDNILEYAQQNAPWNDRTGEARQGLDVEVYEDSGQAVLELFHTVDYGQWLETIQSGRFATIMPTLELFAAKLFRDAGGVVVSGDLA